MDSLIQLLNRFSHEIPQTVVGASFICVIYLCSTVDLQKTLILMQITSVERIFIFIFASFTSGRLLRYIGAASFAVLVAVLNINKLPGMFNHFIEGLQFIKYGKKSTRLMPQNLITNASVYSYIGKNEYVEREFWERKTTSSFCLSLLGFMLLLPMITEIYTSYKKEYILSLLLVVLFSMFAEMNYHRFYGHCVKESQK